ncbi:SRSF kinase 2-like protein [Labeo rohita]|uniref:SRSF kinase 2-like protein n=1 Tax=Labeo rohita TaxID=84645 RepID=A0A498M9L3_LABRO|nr:SRSF kinase 2-like protein [Labeo rohita]
MPERASAEVTRRKEERDPDWRNNIMSSRKGCRNETEGALKCGGEQRDAHTERRLVFPPAGEQIPPPAPSSGAARCAHRSVIVQRCRRQRDRQRVGASRFFAVIQETTAAEDEHQRTATAGETNRKAAGRRC